MIYVETTKAGCTGICTEHNTSFQVYPFRDLDMEGLTESYQNALADVDVHYTEKHQKAKT